MTTLRKATPAQMDDIKRLANAVFRAQRGGDMAQEFPHLYAEANAHHWFVAVDEGRVVAIIGAMVWSAVIAGSLTRVASVGSVATDPAYRKQGLARGLLQLAEASLVAEGARLMLISGDLPIYLNFGARAVGHVRWRLIDSPEHDDVSYRVRPLRAEDDRVVVARLNQERPTRFVRPHDLLPELLTLQPIVTVEKGKPRALLVERHGVGVTYVLVNQEPFGGSGVSRVSEWAGDPQGLLAAVSDLARETHSGVEVPVLDDENGLMALCDARHAPIQETSVPYLVKVLDGVGLFHDLASVLEERCPPGYHISQKPDGLYKLCSGLGHEVVLDPATLTEWMFGHLVADRQSSPWREAFPLPSLWPEGLTYI